MLDENFDLICDVCGKKATSLRLVDGVYTPCGHSKLTEKERKARRKLLDEIGEIFSHRKRGY